MSENATEFGHQRHYNDASGRHGTVSLDLLLHSSELVSLSANNVIHPTTINSVAAFKRPLIPCTLYFYTV